MKRPHEIRGFRGECRYMSNAETFGFATPQPHHGEEKLYELRCRLRQPLARTRNRQRRLVAPVFVCGCASVSASASPAASTGRAALLDAHKQVRGGKHSFSRAKASVRSRAIKAAIRPKVSVVCAAGGRRRAAAEQDQGRQIARGFSSPDDVLFLSL